MIRLGDGEGAVMGYPGISSRADVDRSWNIWLGDSNVTDTELNKLSKSVAVAVSEADIVGLPRKKQTEETSTFLLWRAVIDSVANFNLLHDTQMITDMAIHRYLQFSLLYRPLLSGLDFLGIISSRNVGAELKSEFGVNEIKHYPVRGESAHPGNVQERHYPDGYQKIFDSLEVPFQGAVFLVGAGVFGKVYCNWIKNRGGIALDIGSIFEPWAKVPSRTKHPCHHLDEYSRNPIITAENAVNRYNLLCDKFKMDTPRASTEAKYFTRLPHSW